MHLVLRARKGRAAKLCNPGYAVNCVSYIHLTVKVKPSARASSLEQLADGIKSGAGSRLKHVIIAG
jgi:hypothetical protein